MLESVLCCLVLFCVFNLFGLIWFGLICLCCCLLGLVLIWLGLRMFCVVLGVGVLVLSGCSDRFRSAVFWCCVFGLVFVFFVFSLVVMCSFVCLL